MMAVTCHSPLLERLRREPMGVFVPGAVTIWS